MSTFHSCAAGRRVVMAWGGPHCSLHWPCRSVVTPTDLLIGCLWEELRSDREKVSCTVHELREYYLIVGLMENIMWGWFRSFPEVCQQPQKWSLIENSWGGGWRPASPCFSMPQSCLTQGTQLRPRILPRPWQPPLGSGWWLCPTPDFNMKVETI